MGINFILFFLDTEAIAPNVPKLNFSHLLIELRLKTWELAALKDEPIDLPLGHC